MLRTVRVRGDIAEEGPDRGQAGVAGPRVVAAFAFEMAEEPADELCVDVRDPEFRGLFPRLPLGEADQQAEGVVVAGDGVRARPALLDGALGKEHGLEPGEVGIVRHDATPSRFGRAFARPAASFPVSR